MAPRKSHRRKSKSRRKKSPRRKHKKKKSHRRKKLPSWSSRTAMTQAGRAKMKPSSFLLITKSGRRLYPDATRQNRPSCQGVLAAKMRSALQMHTRAPYGSAKSRRQARQVNAKATRLARAHGCTSMRSPYRKKLSPKVRSAKKRRKKKARRKK